jgi:sialate O-acetylesterase
MKRYLIIFIFALIGHSVWADIKLPALVGDNMVLQRDARINIWGWADPNENISILFTDHALKTKAGKDGRWKIILPPQGAGGPYEMVLKGKKSSVTIKNILIGEVWLASGQSNMELALKYINNASEEIESADFADIRLFTVTRAATFQPQKDVKSDGWKICSPGSAEKFSAVAYLFGRELYKKYKVPVGLIHTSWPGTAAESWTSAEGLTQFPEFSDIIGTTSKIENEALKNYQDSRNEWLKKFGDTDRAHSIKGQSWADVNTNISDWQTMQLPGMWSETKELKGYYGIIWFRKSIEIPVEAAGKSIELHIPGVLLTDSTFFNGHFVGTNSDFTKQRVYTVPGNQVKAGKNVIAIRIAGIKVIGGMMEKKEEFYVKAYATKIPLSGEWMYKSGPDLSSLPIIKGLENFNDMIPAVPVVLYNAMIAPLIPYTIKGVIWYQGEANALDFDKARQYYSLFPSLIKDWRNHWGYDFPFLFVQLAGYQLDESVPADYPWARLREAQTMTLSLPHTGMATTIDIGNQDDIHPKNKQDVAHRLALAAEKVAYSEDLVFSGPTYKGLTIEGDKIRIRFDHTGSGLKISDKYGYLRGFAIAGADQKYVWAKAYQDGNDIMVFSESVKGPVAVRYNWGNAPDGNLYNEEGLPAIPFRTDSWPVIITK